MGMKWTHEPCHRVMRSKPLIVNNQILVEQLPFIGDMSLQINFCQSPLCLSIVQAVFTLCLRWFERTMLPLYLLLVSHLLQTGGEKKTHLLLRSTVIIIFSWFLFPTNHFKVILVCNLKTHSDTFISTNSIISHYL